MSEGNNFALHLLPPAAFPFTLTVYAAKEAADLFRRLGPNALVDLEPVWKQEVHAPDSGLGSVYVPPLVKEHGPVVIGVKWNDNAHEPPQMFWPGCECGHAFSEHKLFARCHDLGCTCHKYRPTAP